MSLTVSPEQEKAIEELLFDWLSETGAPGASLVVVDEDDERFATGVGARDREANDPATPDTLYGYASVTKSFTALAVLQQVEAGTIDLDASIAEYTDATFNGIEDVRIRDLLTHSSGVPSIATSTVLISRYGDLGETGVPLSTVDDLFQYLEDVGEQRDEHSLGRFMYNNTGYYLLEFAVESVTGRSFREYVTTEILAPLGMDRSTFDPEEYTADDDHATPYKPNEDGFEPTEFPSSGLAYGAGGLISSPREMGQYLQFNLTGTTDDGERLVASDLLAEAQEGHVEPLPRYGEGYGYGWMRREIAGSTVVGHGGSLLTSASAIGFCPADGFGVALASVGQPNTHPTEVLEGVVAILQGEDAMGQQPTLAYHDRVDELTGSYTGYRDVVTATVEDEGGHLTMELSMGPLDEELTLVPTDPTLEETTFEAPSPGRPTPVEFVETDDGYDLFYDRYRLHRTG
jgi:CubicO group peptidase (beta-lactamase class C family)